MEKIHASKLLAGLVPAGKLTSDPEVELVTTDSREVKPGCIFVAFPGERFDGHDFAARALEQAGHSRIGGALSVFGMSNEEEQENIKRWQQTISAVIAAVETLQKQKMGALIVFERTTKLGEIVRSGTVINAQPTAELIGNIFFNKAPLHDGAMIIRDGMVHAAGCILPLTENLAISRELGTRHRAGVGISENSDAMVVILSEETGTVSMAVGGELKRNFSSEALRVALENGILWDRARQGKGDKEKKGPFRRWRSK